MRIEPIINPQPPIYFRSIPKINKKEKYINNTAKKISLGVGLSSLFALLMYRLIIWHRRNYYKRNVEYKPLSNN